MTKKELAERIAALEAQVASLSVQLAAQNARGSLYYVPQPYPSTWPQITCGTPHSTSNPGTVVFKESA